MEIVYPADIKGDKRKAFKQRLLHEHPESLYVDLTSQEKRTNLIFYTERNLIWKSVISKYFRYTKKKGICKGCQICIFESADHSSHFQTINLYNSGMILIQGNEASLQAFEKAFPILKQTVEEETTCSVKEESEDENELLPYSPVSTSPTPSDELMTEQATHVSSYLQCLPEKMALLEIEMSELKQLILSRPDEFTINNLKAEIKDLHSINMKLKAEMSKMKEDSIQRERKLEKNIQELNEKLKEQAAMYLQLTNRKSESPNNNCTESNLQLHQEVTSRSSTPPNSMNGHVKERTHTPAPSHRTPETQASVVLMMDSIGKNIEPNKLFPRQRVLTLHCRNIKRVHELLTNEDLGRPQCIIIHTGMNDLHSLNEGTAKAMHEMAEKASQTFPTSRVLVSTLLPRLDVPPSVIDKINEEVRHSCSSLPNVHLVHHSSIRPWHLYDGLHLNQDGVRIFAKTIKDVALGRSPSAGYKGAKRNVGMQPFEPSGPSSHSRLPQELQRQPMTSEWSHRQQERQPYTKGLSQRRGPSQQTPSYAQVLSQQTPTSAAAQELSTSDVGEIKRLLSLLCNKMLN
ncbi:hypothetical protein ROHU_009827 [Labeo rohita]|uniref:Uncharacterized protein n=1 Tax=Labeo rohita TaxID=84645 RepID=A0A498M0Z9_LABRO|nr:hypothetical protein ROHU_009827 [Labeo rohita]